MAAMGVGPLRMALALGMLTFGAWHALTEGEASAATSGLRLGRVLTEAEWNEAASTASGQSSARRTAVQGTAADAARAAAGISSREVGRRKPLLGRVLTEEEWNSSSTRPASLRSGGVTPARSAARRQPILGRALTEEDWAKPFGLAPPVSRKLRSMP